MRESYGDHKRNQNSIKTQSQRPKYQDKSQAEILPLKQVTKSSRQVAREKTNIKKSKQKPTSSPSLGKRYFESCRHEDLQKFTLKPNTK